MNQNAGQKEINKKRKQKIIRGCRPYRRQRGGFLNRYDFAYAGRDTANQAAKKFNSLAPGPIKQESSKVDRLAHDRISQIIN